MAEGNSASQPDLVWREPWRSMLSRNHFASGDKPSSWQGARDMATATTAAALPLEASMMRRHTHGTVLRHGMGHGAWRSPG